MCPLCYPRGSSGYRDHELERRHMATRRAELRTDASCPSKQHPLRTTSQFRHQPQVLTAALERDERYTAETHARRFCICGFTYSLRLICDPPISSQFLHSPPRTRAEQWEHLKWDKATFWFHLQSFSKLPFGSLLMPCLSHVCVFCGFC